MMEYLYGLLVGLIGGFCFGRAYGIWHQSRIEAGGDAK